MMGKYGFGDDPETTEPTVSEEPRIKLPKPKAQPAAKPAPTALKEAVRAGEGLGFVSREPTAAPRGRRRRAAEPQDQLLISGPERIIQRFRDYCDGEDIPSYWMALERLMSAAKIK